MQAIKYQYIWCEKKRVGLNTESTPTIQKLNNQRIKMKQKELSELTDQELLDEAKKKKSSNIFYALSIGFLIGIVIYSIVQNSLGFFTLIPLFLAYKLINNSKYDKKELENLLKERNLK